MKKILFSILSYVIVSSLVVFLYETFFCNMPVVSPSDVLPYKINTGILFALYFIPSSVVTAILVGTSINFQNTHNEGAKRFSNSIVKSFKSVFVICLFCVFVLSLVHDFFIPMFERRKAEFEEKPALITGYLNLSQEYLLKSLKNSEYANLAIFYSKKVLELDSKNSNAKELLKRSELSAARKIKTKSSSSDKQNKDLQKGTVDLEKTPIDSTEIIKIKGSSVYDLVLEAEKLLDAKDYLGAHYYAKYAIGMASQKDPNLAQAKSIANKAWNILSNARPEELTQKNLFFREKLNGYTKLIEGDYLSSYYIFQRLSNTSFEYSKDPDVKRYLNIVRYELTQDYFFIDETNDKDSFESCSDVYFSLKHSDETYDIFLIKGITDINETGNLVRYLREVNIHSFSKDGVLIKSMKVPYAKMLAVDVKTLSEEQQQQLGVDGKWKLIPYVMLCSIDRDNEGVKIEPTYKNSKGQIFAGPNQFFLTMPFSDFSIVSSCTNGGQKLNFWNMNKLILPASTYGYSNEVIFQSLMTSVFYPFMILILLLFISAIGWNYRLRNSNLFKFVWIFIYPCLQVAMYGVVGLSEFLIKLMNFVFMSIVGIQWAIPLGVGFYLIGLIIVCFLFLSRKGD